MTLIRITQPDPEKVTTLIGLQPAKCADPTFWKVFPVKCYQNVASEHLACCKPINVITFFGSLCAISNNVITF